MLVVAIYILIFLVFALIAFAVMQIRLAGINVKDFVSFIKANELLDKLYRFAQQYDKLNPMEQLVFLQEAEKVFSAFDKVPNMLWEEEYQKYMQVLFPSHLPVLYPVFRFHQSPSPDNLPENNNHPLPDILPQPARHTYMFLM